MESIGVSNLLKSDSNNASLTTAKNDALFTTDTNDELIHRETNFLSKPNTFIEFDNNDWWSKIITSKHFESIEMLSFVIPKTIIYSRITKKHYVVTRDVNIDELEENFENTGHTLGIDYTKSYVRYLAFDLDCMCRKIENCENHNNLKDVKMIAVNLMRLLVQTKLVSSQANDLNSLEHNQIIEFLDQYCAIWSNECGFHIYTNILVSITLHEVLLRTLVQLCLPHTKHCNIEIPKIMPLPYSAKRINEPYIPVRANQYSPNIIVPTMVMEMPKFTDNVIVRPSNITIDGCAKSIVITMNENYQEETQVLYYNDSLIPARIIPIYQNAERISKIITDSSTTLLHNYMVYMTNHLKMWKSSMDVAMLDTSNNTNIITEEQNWKTHQLTDFKNYKSNDFDYLVKSFILTFNKKFIGGQNIDSDSAYFIGLSLDYGCLYLQHYVVMFHLWLLEHSSDVKKITCLSVIDCLKRIYTHETINNSLCLQTFLENYSLTTLGAYKHKSYELIHHFAYLKTFDIKPHMNIIEALNKIMCQKIASPLEYANELINMKKREREAKHMIVFDCYCRALHELGIVMVDSQTNMCHVLNHHVYTSDDAEKVCPNILSNWIRDSPQKYNTAAIFQYLRMQEYSTTIDPKLMFTTTEFQMQTNIGSFNSITGMYSAHCKFLRFTRKRDYAIWFDPFQNDIKQTEHQNLRCLQLQAWTREFVLKLPHYVSNLFIDFVLVPAILQIGLLPSIEEEKLFEISNVLTDREIPDSSNFIVEYYQMHPIYIYLITIIYKKYDGFLTLCDYSTLRTHIFQHRRSDDEAWYNFLLNLAKNCIYDKQAVMHMDRLTSIHDNGNLENLNTSFALKISIFALMMSKSVNFNTFNAACASVCNTIDNKNRDNNTNVLLKIDSSKIPSQYLHLMNKMSNIKTKDELIDIYRENLKVTKSRLFVDISAKPLPFDPNQSIRNCIIDTFIVISMSSFFNIETTKNIIDAFSLLFVTKNLKKKLILFYGKSGVGKSELCNMIRYMMAPFVGVYNNSRYDVANQRANVSTTTNCIILTEVEALDGNAMKSQTGNDSVSAIRFFTTSYDLRDSQALLYGNTNGHLNFKTASTRNVDQVTIDRLHVIELTGQQIDAEESNVTDFLSMLVDNTIFKNTVPLNADNIQFYAICMAMISFVNYKETRSKQDYMPALDINTQSSVRYRSETFKLNNKLYRFLLNLGFQREPKFYICKQELLRLVSKAIERANRLGKKSSIMYKCDDDFYIDFKREFNVDLKKIDNSTIKNIQEYGLIEHIKNNLRVEPSIGNVITFDDVQARINCMFNSSNKAEFTTHKANARDYMMRQNLNVYDSVNKYYRDIKFVQDTSEYMVDYDNSENPDLNEASSVPMDTSNIVSSPEVTMYSVLDKV